MDHPQTPRSVWRGAENTTTHVLLTSLMSARDIYDRVTGARPHRDPIIARVVNRSEKDLTVYTARPYDTIPRDLPEAV